MKIDLITCAGGNANDVMVTMDRAQLCKVYGSSPATAMERATRIRNALLCLEAVEQLDRVTDDCEDEVEGLSTSFNEALADVLRFAQQF